MRFGRPREQHPLSDVFVVGKDPTITYSPREDRHFEERLRDYIEERGRVLVITGPSKSGKTVLLRHTIDRAVWLAGGQIGSISQFWRQVVDRGDGWTGETRSHSRTDAESTEIGGHVSLKPVGIGGQAAGKSTGAVSDSSMHERRVDRDVQSVGISVLRASGAPIVIDDFHHMAPQVQAQVMRELKSLIDEGLAVIFAAVPHHAADAVMAESEMESRVENLQIGLWDGDELAAIARRGYDALNVEMDDVILAKLTGFSFRSPHLMQLLCRELAKNNNIRSTLGTRSSLLTPHSWDRFLSDIAIRHTDDQVYRDLVRGPQTRKNRAQRPFRATGQVTDIYGAVMAAVRATGPRERLPYNVLRDELRKLLHDLPQKEQTTNTLKHMSEIAHRHAQDEHGRLKRDPVVEWQPDRDTLYVSDPFFSFRMRYGPQAL